MLDQENQMRVNGLASKVSLLKEVWLDKIIYHLCKIEQRNYLEYYYCCNFIVIWVDMDAYIILVNFLMVFTCGYAYPVTSAVDLEV